jgi:hypothetical protein
MSARSPWFASALCVLCAAAGAQTQAQFTQQDLPIPARVEARLKEGVSAEDKKIAAALLKGGLRRGPLTRLHDFGAVTKELCGSAVYHPTAQALRLCAEASARFDRMMTGRLAQGEREEHLNGSLAHLDGLLASAVAATAYSAMTARDKRALTAERQCVAAYIEGRQLRAHCAPLKWLGVPAGHASKGAAAQQRQ